MNKFTTKPGTGSEEHTEYIKKVLSENGITFKKVLDTGYDPDYQGYLILVELEKDEDEILDKLVEDEFNLGDDSYQITKFAPAHYLFDICE